VWRAGTAAQNWGEAPAPQAQCATPLGLSLSEGLGRMLCKERVEVFNDLGAELGIKFTSLDEG
jgi:hypothetical protein